MDPWEKCTRLYDDHFMDRMKEKHLPKNQVEDALKVGKKIEEKKGEFEIRWNSWTLKVSQRECFLHLRTAFLN